MNGIGKWTVLAGLAVALPGWAGSATLLDAGQLTQMLNRKQPCCVVDARSGDERKAYPIAFAVGYSPNIKPKAGAYALVIGDSDQQALTTANAISRRSGQDAHAIKGGNTTWQQVAQYGARTPTADMPKRFIIPSNTCETGPALHEYK